MPRQSTKRKAPSNPDTPAKKVRIAPATGMQDQPTVSPSARPKRASVGKPEYNYTSRRSSSTQNATSTVAEHEPAAKKRGRPPKISTSPAPASEQVTNKKRGRQARNPASPAPKDDVTSKKRGRPAKIAKASPAVANTSSTQTSRAVASKKTAPKTSAKTPDPRGRKAKASIEIPKPLAGTETDSEDPLALNGSSTKDSGGDKPEDLAAIDPDVQYWLMKAEPDSRIEKGHDVKFSIDDLAARTEPEAWDGVRNSLARNNMRAMRTGDLAFFYHSNCTVPGVAGVMRIVAEHSVDESAFNPDHPYFDPKSDRANPKWEVVHVEFVKKFENLISLRELKSFSKSGGSLEGMQLFRMSRLSVSSVSPAEWRFILELAGEPASLGHGDGMGGYESEVDGEGEETAGVSDADGLNGSPDGAVNP